MVAEIKQFKSFHYGPVGANDQNRVANLGPKGLIDRVYKGEY